MSILSHPIPAGGRGSPPWAIATLYPNQGHWTEGEYLDLSERTNRIIEMSDGCVEVLELPTITHQMIGLFLYRALFAFMQPPRLGRVIAAAYPLRLTGGTFREPDVLFVLAQHLEWFGKQFATGADCVIEILSQDRKRDMEEKRADYEAAGIPEYWLVDDRDRRITVLKLVSGKYEIAGDYVPGQRALSVVLAGFSVDVAEVFAAEG
jgi:Uma2 family endonuclease